MTTKMLTVDGRSDLALGAKHISLESTMNGTMTSMPTSPASLEVQVKPQHRHMWIVTGPAGCGKSTVAAYLSQQLSIPYIEGDDVQQDPIADKNRTNLLCSIIHQPTA